MNAMMAKKQQKGNKVRAGVSAEVYGEYNKKENFKARIIKKTSEERTQIKEKLLKSFLFKTLDENDLETCIDAMEIKKYKYGDKVIQQGNDGAELYIVGNGFLNCFKLFPGKSEPTLLLTYQPGMAFGEYAYFDLGFPFFITPPELQLS